MNKKEIEQKVQSLVNEACDGQRAFALLFDNSSDEDDRTHFFDMGFIMGVGWVGSLFGLDFCPASREEKDKIDDMLRQAAKV